MKITVYSLAQTQNTDLIADFIAVHGIPVHGHFRKLPIKNTMFILYKDLHAEFTLSLSHFIQLIHEHISLRLTYRLKFPFLANRTNGRAYVTVLSLYVCL